MPFRRTSRLPTTLYRRLILSIGQYPWVCILKRCPCLTGLFYTADCVNPPRQGMATERCLYSNTAKTEHPWKVSTGHYPPPKAHSKTEATNTCGWLISSLLDVPGSFFFRRHRYCLFANSISITCGRAISVKLLSYLQPHLPKFLWHCYPYRLHFMLRRTSVSHVHLWIIFDQTAKSWNLTRIYITHVP